MVASVLENLPGVRDWGLVDQPAIERLDLADRLLDGSTRAKPGDHLVAVVVELGRRPILRGERYRHVEAAVPLAEEAEILGEHTDDRVRPPVDAEILGQDARITAEALLPEAVAEDHHLLVAEVHLLFTEVPPDQRSDSE